MKKSLIIILAVLLLSSCVTPPPKDTDNVCRIFKQYPKWYWATQEAQRNWGVPISVQMAILQQESHFKAKAKPPRRWLLGIIPWFRPSSASGYTQALEETWDDYKKTTGNTIASRDNFRDATDFIGWYVCRTHQRLGISKFNTYALYLAYHEGAGGYQRKTYLKKPWLINVAKRVAYRSRLFAQQLKGCQSSLKVKHWWNFF